MLQGIRWRKLFLIPIIESIDGLPAINRTLVGYFYLVLRHIEKKGGCIMSDPCKWLIMEYIISSCNIIYIKPNKGRFISTNIRLGYRFIVELLDRFLIKDYILDEAFNLFSMILDNMISDHKTIIVELFILWDIGQTPSKLNPSWFNQDGFKSLIYCSWNTLLIEGGEKYFRWERKIRRLI